MLLNVKPDMETKQKCVISHIWTDAGRFVVVVATEKRPDLFFLLLLVTFCFLLKWDFGFIPQCLKSELFRVVFGFWRSFTPSQDVWWLWWSFIWKHYCLLMCIDAIFRLEKTDIKLSPVGTIGLF